MIAKQTQDYVKQWYNQKRKRKNNNKSTRTEILNFLEISSSLVPNFYLHMGIEKVSLRLSFTIYQTGFRTYQNYIIESSISEWLSLLSFLLTIFTFPSTNSEKQYEKISNIQRHTRSEGSNIGPSLVNLHQQVKVSSLHLASSAHHKPCRLVSNKSVKNHKKNNK